MNLLLQPKNVSFLILFNSTKYIQPSTSESASLSSLPLKLPQNLVKLNANMYQFNLTQELANALFPFPT